MKIKRAFILIVSFAVAIAACVPVEREYGEHRDFKSAAPRVVDNSHDDNASAIGAKYAGLDMAGLESLADSTHPPPWAQPPVWDLPPYNPPPFGGGDGVPTCFNSPMFSDGYNGCMPTVGGDGFGSIQLRAPGGETMQFVIGGRQNLYLEDFGPEAWPHAEFAGTTKALSYSESVARVTNKNFSFAPWTPTVLIDGSSTVVKGYLPWAGIEPGIRFTAKLINGTKAAIYPYDGDKIDGATVYKISGDKAFVTVVSGDENNDGISDSWWVVNRSYP